MIVIIMAGGMGKRMESDLPKVLHKVTYPNNKNIEYPMIIHVIMTSLKLNPTKIFIIVGKYRKIITETINNYIEQNVILDNEQIEYVDQEIPMGTAHAIQCCLNQIAKYSNSNTNALILSGDVPLITYNTLKKLLEGKSNRILITQLLNPFGCGRILFGQSGNLIGIREEKDCNEEEKLINLVNCGIYKISIDDLINLIPKISNNNKSNEYYLTDIIDLMIKDNIYIDTWKLNIEFQWEIKNVNTKKDLEELNKFICTLN